MQMVIKTTCCYFSRIKIQRNCFSLLNKLYGLLAKRFLLLLMGIYEWTMGTASFKCRYQHPGQYCVIWLRQEANHYIALSVVISEKGQLLID